MANLHSRGTIIAVEEPETALHPDMQNVVWSSLAELSELPRQQILMTTHSTNLLRDLAPERIRYMRPGAGGKRELLSVTSGTPETELLAAITSTMGTLTDHSVRCFLLVEGRNDVESLIALCQVLHSAHR